MKAAENTLQGGIAVSEAFEKFLRDGEDGGFHILYAQVRRGGEVTDDWAWVPARPRFESFSTSKSFVGAGVGIALEEGLLRLDERVIESFPEESRGVTAPYAFDITVRDMLTMTSGVSNTMFWREGRERRHEKDWVRYFFEHGRFEHRPGTTFLYNNANSYMLGCLIEKKSGRNLREYLRWRLFEPLEIHNPEWTSCPMGHTVAANSLSINADELGRFGQMLADGGVYNGRRLVPEAYVKEMLTSHTETGEILPSHPGLSGGYGYQIWIDRALNAAFLWGIFGQYCVILPEKNAVVTVMALQKDDGGSNGQYDVSPLRRLIWDDLLTQL